MEILVAWADVRTVVCQAFALGTRMVGHRDHGEADDRSNGGTAAHLGSIGNLAPRLERFGDSSSTRMIFSRPAAVAAWISQPDGVGARMLSD